MFGRYNLEDAEKLIRFARESIREKFTGIKPEMPQDKQFRQLRGVFVTLTEQGRLRGCIGFLTPVIPLAEAVKEAAKSAAFSDPRFSRIEEKELDNVKIEISILTNPIGCRPEEIKIGRDGLACEYLGYSGLLLPQVAIEHKLSRLEFLEAVCQKSCLPKDSWQKSGFKLKRFQAQIFYEGQDGKVKEKICDLK